MTFDWINVAEVFYFASKAVLHPTAPLYDVAEHVRIRFDRTFPFEIFKRANDYV